MVLLSSFAFGWTYCFWLNNNKRYNCPHFRMSLAWAFLIQFMILYHQQSIELKLTLASFALHVNLLIWLQPESRTHSTSHLAGLSLLIPTMHRLGLPTASLPLPESKPTVVVLAHLVCSAQSWPCASLSLIPGARSGPAACATAPPSAAVPPSAVPFRLFSRPLPASAALGPAGSHRLIEPNHKVSSGPRHTAFGPSCDPLDMARALDLPGPASLAAYLFCFLPESPFAALAGSAHLLLWMPAGVVRHLLHAAVLWLPPRRASWAGPQAWPRFTWVLLLPPAYLPPNNRSPFWIGR